MISVETTNLRNALLSKFNDIADVLEANRSAVISCLMSVESAYTANDELEKSVRALRTYKAEIPFISDRVPDGDVAVFLPFNNPLYSFVLYCFGPVLGGSNVVFRPSSITGHTIAQLWDLLSAPLSDLPITVAHGSGADFVEFAVSSRDIGTLLFTGSWQNLTRLENRVPPEKRLVYCGSGINPFVVSSDALEFMNSSDIVKNIIESRIYNSGQDCLCSERIYLSDDIADGLLDELESSVRNLTSGDFGADNFDIVPLLGSLSESVRLQAQSTLSSANWRIPFENRGALVVPSIAELELDDPFLVAEKFSPVFTVSRFHGDKQLSDALRSEYRFGATVIGSFDDEVLQSFPHVSRSQNIIETEAEDSHVPFGGRGRSGFVRHHGEKKDGPILYSVETTIRTT